MNNTAWVDRAAYPFAPRYFNVDGARMHYIDEGDGPPIVMVHGTPTWSFLYRDLIRTLAPRYRCIAPDHLGYGLSDKPERAAYQPKDHARRLQALIEHLELRDLAMIVHDFGGPVGLSYALEKPSNIRSLVLLNTWMWSLRGDLVPELASRLGGGSVGRFFFRQFNIEARWLFKAVWGDRSKLGSALHRQYTSPFPEPGDREAMWVLARELLGSSEWYEELWSRRKRISTIPALLLWGLKDPIFRVRHLARWQGLFEDARSVTFSKAGHFVQEEARDELRPALDRFLGGATDRRHETA
jgi:haloalkane dehalogenase